MAITDRRGAVVSAADPAQASDPNPGLAYKTAVQCVALTAISLSGLPVIDGYQVRAGDRVLVAGQGDATTNAIYNAASGSWSLATDNDSSPELAPGAQVLVLNGGADGSTVFVCTSAPPIVLGTSAINWSPLPKPPSALEFVLDGGGTTIVTGDRIYIEVPFDCVISRSTLVASTVGSIEVDIYRTPFANFPGASSICGGNLPALNTAQKSQDAVLSGWSVQLSAGDILTLHVVSVSGVSLATLSLLVNRS